MLGFKTAGPICIKRKKFFRSSRRAAFFYFYRHRKENIMEKNIEHESGQVAEGQNLPITIMPELEELLPGIPAEEKEALRKSIESEGIRDSLLVWRMANDQGQTIRILVDGHNRYRIAESLGWPPERLPVVDYEFDDMEEVKGWIIANQLMRRNLTDIQRSYFRGKIYIARKQEHGGDRKSSGQNDHLKTSEILAEQFGVSEKTIRRDAAFAKAVDELSPERQAAVLAGKEKLSKPGKANAAPVDESPENEPEDSQAARQESPEDRFAGSESGDSLPDDLPISPADCFNLIHQAMSRAAEYFAKSDLSESDRDSMGFYCNKVKDDAEKLREIIKDRITENGSPELDEAEADDSDGDSPDVPDTPAPEATLNPEPETFGDIVNCQHVATFAVVDGPSKGKAIRLGVPAQITIGSAEVTNLQLEGPDVAAFHVVIDRQEDAARIDGELDSEVKVIPLPNTGSHFREYANFSAGQYLIGENVIEVTFEHAS